jgi:hypothetical protein
MGVWEIDDVMVLSHWRVSGLVAVHTPTSTSASLAGGRCLAFTTLDEASRIGTLGKAKAVNGIGKARS